MKYKDRILAFAGSNKHVKVRSKVLREDIILAGFQSKVESTRTVIYQGGEIMAMLKLIRQGMTREELRRIHELKRIFKGLVLYSLQDEKLHRISRRCDVARDRREHPAPSRRWSDRIRQQPSR